MDTISKEELYISKEVRENLDERNARFILERADLTAQSVLEQLRKSTDRAYTLFGLLLTAFSGTVAFMLSTKNIFLLIPVAVFCTGLFLSIYILFSKGIWVHAYRDIGNEPQNLLEKENIELLNKKSDKDKEALNRLYVKNIIFDSIENTACSIRTNGEILNQRVGVVQKALEIIKATVYTVAFISLVALIARWFVF